MLAKRKDLDINKTNSIGQSAVALASLNNNKSLIRLLLRRPDIEIDSGNRISLLHNAVRENDTELVRILLSKEYIDVNREDEKGNTALHIALKYGNLDVAKMLLSHPKIAINRTDKEGNTPLHIAANRGFVALVKIMLSINSEMISQENDKGMTPLKIAAFNIVEPLVKKAYSDKLTNYHGISFRTMYDLMAKEFSTPNQSWLSSLLPNNFQYTDLGEKIKFPPYLLRLEGLRDHLIYYRHIFKCFLAFKKQSPSAQTFKLLLAAQLQHPDQCTEKFQFTKEDLLNSYFNQEIAALAPLVSLRNLSADEAFKIANIVVNSEEIEFSVKDKLSEVIDYYKAVKHQHPFETDYLAAEEREVITKFARANRTYSNTELCSEFIKEVINQRNFAENKSIFGRFFTTIFAKIKAIFTGVKNEGRRETNAIHTNEL
ncbi:MAG: ankyrin repeat domain-containing protein, partial [Burkholderiales bacterium]